MLRTPPDYSNLEYETVARRFSGQQMAPGLVIADSTQSTVDSTLNVSGKIRNDGDGQLAVSGSVGRR